MRKHFLFKDQKTAQTASELAIFGGVLLFVIGSIIRTGMNSSQAMNQQLRAMRLAMTESYRTAEGAYRPGREESGARNTATIFILEDRLTADPHSKYTDRDRIPFIGNGSATFSKNLFLPIDFGEVHNLPIYDIFVNGQRFPFITSNFKSVTLNQNNFSPCDPPMGASTGRPSPTGIVTNGACWEPSCFTETVQIGIDPNTGLPITIEVVRGCVIMFTVVGNFNNSTEWCVGGCTTNMSADNRFNLDFVGGPDVATTLRTSFMWQWVKVAGVRNDVRAKLIPPVEAGVQGIDIDGRINTLIDVDGDYKEEAILSLSSAPNGQITQLNVMDNQEGDMNFTTDDRDSGEWVIVSNRCDVSDPLCVCPTSPTGPCQQTVGGLPNERDGRNLTGGCATWRCVAIELGVQSDMMMFSFTSANPTAGQPGRQGTFFRIEEGKLFNLSTGQFIRHVNRQDHVDIIQRVMRISRDTDRFCNSSGAPTNWAGIDGLLGLTNPVEACNNCFSPANIERTCMDEDELRIFIRSRLRDLRGRRWVTRVDP